MKRIVFPLACLLLYATVVADSSDDTLSFFLSKSELVVVGKIASEPMGVYSEAGVPNYICAFEISEVLKGGPPKTTKIDDSIAGKIPAIYAEFFMDKTIYMAGTMNYRGKDYPFILIQHKGNPHIAWFRERDGNPMGDAESFNVMLTVATDPKNDLLFIGGDFNNQPFTAYERE